MAKQNFTINFDGYRRDEHKSGLPSKSGIYCVYTCVHNAQKNTVALKKLLYIGKADNINDRLANHERLPDWKKRLQPGQVLCYSYGEIGPDESERCEAAMIFEHQPPENTDCKQSFSYDETTISLTGKTALLTTRFTVSRT